MGVIVSLRAPRAGELRAFQKADLTSSGFLPSPMPSYATRLTPQEVADAAAYLLEQLDSSDPGAVVAVATAAIGLVETASFFQLLWGVTVLRCDRRDARGQRGDGGQRER